MPATSKALVHLVAAAVGLAGDGLGAAGAAVSPYGHGLPYVGTARRPSFNIVRRVGQTEGGSSTEAAALAEQAAPQASSPLGAASGDGGLLTRLAGKGSLMSVAGLLKKVEGMIGTEVTPEAAKFINETRILLQQTVVPHVFKDHGEDQALLDSLYARFEGLTANYTDATGALAGQNATVASAQAAHTDCRQEEVAALKDDEECLEGVDAANSTRNIYLNDFLAAADAACDAYDVLPVPEELWDTKAEKYRTYLEKLKALEASAGSVIDKAAVCEANTSLALKTSTCNTAQATFEREVCTLVSQIENACSIHSSLWAVELENLRITEDNVRLKEGDRKVEYTGLQLIDCLLLSIAGNGTHGSVGISETTIDMCRNKTVDTSALDITYQDAPTMKPCVEVPPAPCESAFLTTAYANLSSAAAACVPCAPLAGLTDTAPNLTFPGA